MKRITAHLFKNIFLFFFFISIQKLSAQTTLAAGDIAFTGYVSAAVGTDEFSFVLLKNITTGTVINFTDNAWLNTNAFRTGEQIVTWTSGAALTAGTEIKISGPSIGVATPVLCCGNPANAGTCAGAMLSLSTSGDQVLAYQGTVGSPGFISAIHMNVYTTLNFDPVSTTAAAWDGTNSNNTSASALPLGLTTGTTALWMGVQDVAASEFDNVVFNCTGPLGTPAQIRAAVNNQLNWTKQNGAPTVVTPTSCSFLSVLPVKLVSFTGQLNSNLSATLQWRVEEQLGIKEYFIERSPDGLLYKPQGSVAASSLPGGNYSFTDMQLTDGKNYYRLKILEEYGKITYSNSIVINFRPAINLQLYPNPVTDKLTVQYTGGLTNKIARLCDGQGRVLLRIRLTNQQQIINMKAFAPGIYYIKMEDGTITKLIKQN